MTDHLTWYVSARSAGKLLPSPLGEVVATNEATALMLAHQKYPHIALPELMVQRHRLDPAGHKRELEEQKQERRARRHEERRRKRARSSDHE